MQERVGENGKAKKILDLQSGRTGNRQSGDGLVPGFTPHSENSGMILAGSVSMVVVGAQRINSHLR